MTKLVSKSAQSEFSDEQVSNFLDMIVPLKGVSFIDEREFKLIFSYYDKSSSNFHEFEFAFTQFDTTEQLLDKFYIALDGLEETLQERNDEREAITETESSLYSWERL